MTASRSSAIDVPPPIPTTSIRLDFSLLLPVWAGDRPDHLTSAFRSAVNDQTRRPNEVVLVQDGPVSDDLAECLRRLRSTSPVPVTLVELSHNGGLGPALDMGLRHCRYDIVARMDADDLALPHRFEVQLPLMLHADIVGAGLLEFSGSPEVIVGQRTPPLGAARISSYARVHDPFNHPTVVYRRSAVVAAGGYGDLALMEDYWLFARMLSNGAAAINVADPLVLYRVGAEAYKRRGGTTLLQSEIRLQRRLRDEGFLSRWQYRRNVAVRGGYRLIPWWMRRGLYRAAVSRPGSSARTTATTGVSELAGLDPLDGRDGATVRGAA